MPKGKKFGGRDFLPGNNANPKGAPRIPKDLKEIRKISRYDIEQRVLELSQKTEKEIEEILKDPDLIIRDKLIIRVALRGIAKGDPRAMEFLIDFIFGKRPDKVNVDVVSQNLNMDAQLPVSTFVKNPEILEDLIKLESKIKSFRNKP